MMSGSRGRCYCACWEIPDDHMLACASRWGIYIYIDFESCWNGSFSLFLDAGGGGVVVVCCTYMHTRMTLILGVAMGNLFDCWNLDGILDRLIGEKLLSRIYSSE